MEEGDEDEDEDVDGEVEVVPAMAALDILLVGVGGKGGISFSCPLLLVFWGRMRKVWKEMRRIERRMKGKDMNGMHRKYEKKATGEKEMIVGTG